MESRIEILSLASLVVRTVKPCVLSMMTESRIPCGGFFKTEYVIVSSVWFFLLVKNYFVSLL